MFFAHIFAYMDFLPYLCIVFFMVLDLRLMKIGLSGDNPSFFVYPPPYISHSYYTDTCHSSVKSLIQHLHTLYETPIELVVFLELGWFFLL